MPVSRCRLGVGGETSKPTESGCKSGFVREPKVERNRETRPEAEIRELAPYLREPVTDPIVLPGTTSPEVLPFEQRSSRDFERICLVIAEQVDRLRDVRLYGMPGQKQHGVDLVGWNEAGEAVVYQVRRWATFSEADLRDAVEDYSAGARPFDAKKFVLCLSSAANRTGIIEELHLLRARRDLDLEIDLYDQGRLSEMLKQRGDLVRRLFGDPWHQVFCLGEPLAPPGRTDADVRADAILRGPLEALNIADDAAIAQDISDSDPSRAEELYDGVADRLENSDFAIFAAPFRQRQADASVRAGNLDKATRLIVVAGWKECQNHPGPWLIDPIRSLRRLAERSGAPASAGLMADIFSAAEQWYADPSSALDRIVLHIGDLVDTDAPGSHQTTLWLAETAIASEQYELVRRLSAGVCARVR